MSFIARFVSALFTRTDGPRASLFYNTDAARIASVSLLFPINVVFALLYADGFDIVQGIPLYVPAIPLVISLLITTYYSYVNRNEMVMPIAIISLLGYWPIFSFAIGQSWLMWLPHLIGAVSFIVIQVQTGKSLEQILFNKKEK
jgi:hypothetical protein